eukprot:g6737.t1
MGRTWSGPLPLRYCLPVTFLQARAYAPPPADSFSELGIGRSGHQRGAPRQRRTSAATTGSGGGGSGFLKRARLGRGGTPTAGPQQLPPIDVVIPYVIATAHQMEHFLAFCPKEKEQWHRMRDLGTLESLLLSIERYLPFVRKVHIVHNGELPNWLTTRQFGFSTSKKSSASKSQHFAGSTFWAEETNRLHFVSHQEMWDPKSRDHDLPTFNTDAITSQIGRIPGLAEHFVYAEDDMIFLRPISPHDLFDFRATDASDIRGESGQELVPRFGRPYLLARQAELPKERRPEPEAGKKGSSCPVGMLWASHMPTVLRKNDLAKALQQINAMTKKEMRTNMDAHWLMTEDERRASDTGYGAGESGLADMVPHIKCRSMKSNLAPCDGSFRFRLHWVLFHYFEYQASPLEQVRGEGAKTPKGSQTTPTASGKHESLCGSKRSPYFWDVPKDEKAAHFEKSMRAAWEDPNNCPKPAVACMNDDYALGNAGCEAEITALHALLRKFAGGPEKLQHVTPPSALCADAANDPETAREAGRAASEASKRTDPKTIMLALAAAMLVIVLLFTRWAGAAAYFKSSVVPGTARGGTTPSAEGGDEVEDGMMRGGD